MRVGRPLKFESVEILQASCDRYFEQTDKEIWTITGLAIFLDTSRETLMEYERGEGSREEFVDTIKKAKLKIEHAYELRLVNKGRTADIFALKNFGWEDKQTNENFNRNLNVNLSDKQKQEVESFLNDFGIEEKPNANKQKKAS